MSSPAKVRKEGEDAVEGFVFDVSPRKLSKNSSAFFTAVLQSARQEYHRVVVFAMEKQALFVQAEKNGNPVRLRNVRRSLSFSDPDGFDVLCSRGTSVEVTRLPFLRCAPPSCKRMTVAEVKALGPSTGPSSSIEHIADLEVAEGAASAEDEKSTALFSATIKGIEVTIQRRCSACHFKQKEFVEKSKTHRCEGCRMKQHSLSFSASFGGKATVSTASGDETVQLSSSALSTYLRDAGLSSMSNDAEAIEDNFLQSPPVDLKVNVDGFLLSIQPAEAGRAVGAEDQWDTDADEGQAQPAEQGGSVA
ncbi:uncharacterized protein LOC127968392 isoform X9 [Carassius gibelio]|uniref:uncharacterized protein LOC127968392 isoform X7 n=1 Tax=Carassius gibelio TaxID=101364 RepID=UPI002279785B|nr:uncharacterized protein LOC127968392 isoform X7 [Carassius gibelio]XP_052425547.1 uncharacterized protein LOC127968392 isoform X8 [Carassius gibelio]XP_052425548.1 uncharacterized protein LOC127968392 isoform X9 [Carassius gibelio]